MNGNQNPRYGSLFAKQRNRESNTATRFPALATGRRRFKQEFRLVALTSFLPGQKSPLCGGFSDKAKIRN
jgi:hypothetical protein